MVDAPRQPVKLGSDDDVDLTPPRGRQECIERLASFLGA